MLQSSHAPQHHCRHSRMSGSGIHPELKAALGPFAATTSCGRHQEICSEATYDDYLRQVVSGAVGKYSTQPDGRRQMIDLLLPGDFFGFISQHDHEFTVEAIVESTVVTRYPRKRVEALAEADPLFTLKLQEVVFATLSRTEGMLIILGRVTALEKVGAFLIEMTDRLQSSAHDDVVLPVSRSDIGNFLAISPETVSRALSDLKCRGIIRFTGTRRVQIVDRDAIEN